MLVTTSPEANSLQYIFCIYYPFYFQGGQAVKVKALIDSNNKINTITPAFIANLGLHIRLIDIGA